MRRTLALTLLTAACLVTAGAYSGWKYGYQAGRDAENGLWRRVLISSNCAGYTADTGEWVLNTGGTCSPMYVNAMEGIENGNARSSR